MVFFLRGKQKFPITNHAKPTLCKEREVKSRPTLNHAISNVYLPNVVET